MCRIILILYYEGSFVYYKAKAFFTTGIAGSIYTTKKSTILLIDFCIYLFYKSSNRFVVGAGSENRTRATRSEAWHSTTKLYPQIFNNNILYIVIQTVSKLVVHATIGIFMYWWR